MKQVTIKDLARMAGVTHATVSRALKGQPGVNPLTRQKILQLAAAIGYRPNLVARRLSERRSFTIGVAWPGLGSTWVGFLAEQIHQAFIARGYEVVFSMERPDKAAMLFDQQMIDGVVIGGANEEERLRLLNWRERTGKPMVSAGFKLDESIPSVDCDRAEAIRLAVNHLAKNGYHRIALISFQETKIAGYWQGLCEQNLTYLENYVKKVHYNNSAVTVALDELLRLPEPPDAIIGGGARAGIHLVNALRARGLAVPEQVAVVAYDDIPGCVDIEVPVTTVGPPAAKMAEAVAEMLLTLIEKRKEVHHLKITPELTVRSSCGAARRAEKEGVSSQEKPIRVGK